MAGISRPPGSTGTVDKTRVVQQGTGYSYGAPNKTSESIPALNTYTTLVERHVRPSYNKGTVVTLPGGTKFRKSTNYSNESTVLKTSGHYSCGHWDKNAYQWRHYSAYDEGRGLGNLITGHQSPTGISIPTDAYNEAVTKALLKLADQKINAGEFLATVRQTAGMVVTYSERLKDALYVFRHASRFKPYLGWSAREIWRRGILNTAAEEYLQYVYGLKPLMQDVYTGVEILKKVTADPILLKGVGKATRDAKVSPGGGTLDQYSSYRRLSGQGKKKVKATIWARLDPNFSGLRALNQMGLINPASLAWELMPYSFVVDWFIPVGHVLNALSARVGLIFVDGSVSVRSSDVVSYEYMHRSASHLHVDQVPDPVGAKVMRVDRIYEGYGRTVMPDWPRPGFWMTEDPFSGDRPLKALALAILGLKKIT